MLEKRLFLVYFILNKLPLYAQNNALDHYMIKVLWPI